MKRFLALALALVAAALFAPSAHAAGPWRAQIVDGESGQPLDGVVVVFVFLKYHKGLIATSGYEEYYAADEALTGPDGRFEIPARMLWNPIRIFTEIRVEITFFKPGYGRGRYREAPQQQEERRELLDRQILERDDVIVELPLLKTREERLKFYDSLSAWMYPRVPSDRVPRFLEADTRERAYLGLPPLKRTE